MWRIDAPIDLAPDTFDVCTSIIRSNDLRKRMQDSRQAILDEGEVARVAFKGIAVDALPVSDMGSVSVNSNELLGNYTSRMVRAGTPGRDIYDRIMGLAENERCGLCGQRWAKTLDHFVCKDRNPTLAVYPFNLIPSCWDCNHSKRQIHPAVQADQFFHPFFEGLDDRQWLFANVKEGSTPVFEFEVRVPSPLFSELEGVRAKNQFSALSLASLYRSEAGVIWSNTNRYIRRIIEVGGAPAAREELLELEAAAAAFKPNSLFRAFYGAAAESAWLCGGGFVEA